MSKPIAVRKAQLGSRATGMVPIPGKPHHQPRHEKADLSLVVTIFNERESLPQLYREIVAVLQGRRWELIFVDDGSTDGSYEIAATLHRMDTRVNVIRFRRNFGKTAALSAGIAVAQGEIVVTMDADLQDDPREIPHLIEALADGHDLVTGWRKMRHDPLSKRVSSFLFNRTVSTLTGVHLHDINCGLKAFCVEAAKDLKLYGEMHRFLPVLASQRGYRVAEMEVSHRQRAYGHSKYGWGRALAALLDIQTVVFLTRYLSKPLRFFGTVGITLLAIGIAIGTYLTVLHFQGAEIGRRPLLLLSTLLVLSGCQWMSTGLIGEMLKNLSFDRKEEYSISTVLRHESPDGF